MLGWRVSREEEFDGIDYAVHRETGYDLGGPGMRPGGVPAGNKSAAELGLNESREQRHHHSARTGAPADTVGSRKE